jgi:DNA-binding transcriptional regulator YiaG
VTVTRTNAHPIWPARLAENLSREKVVRLLDPPVSAKTLERWERGITPVPKWRVRQLAAIYRIRLSDLKDVAA